MSDAENTKSGPALSDSEIDEDSDNHETLLSAIGALGKKRKRVEQRSEGSSQVSEHYLGTEELGTVKVGELLAGVKTPSLVALQQRLASAEEKEKPQPTPLSRVTADKLHRGVAYVESCKQAAKWAPIVKKNRESEHLSFPLQEEVVATPSLTSQVEHFKPQSEFECKIANVLAGSRNIEVEGEELTQAEREALTQFSLEEAAERRKELRKMRALMTYYEQKAKRAKKIKSKKFHRIQRKKREAKQAKEQPMEDEETEDKVQRLRAQERMTLKHSRQSKWAKQQLARAHRNPATQEALSELHSKRQALKQQGKSDLAQDSSSEGEGLSDNDHSLSDTDHGNPWLRQSARESEGKNVHISQVTVTSVNMTTEPHPSHLSNVAEAFAGDDVVREFTEEKKQLLEDSKAKTVDLTLPGWGAWGGQGVKPPRKARKMLKKIPEKPRRDANIKNVIISENVVAKRMDKHLVKDVPWPYTTLDQYNRTHSAPLGRHWNTEGTFHSIIKPRVTTATGQIIEPLKLTDDVQGFMKRTQKKNKTLLANKRKKKLST